MTFLNAIRRSETVFTALFMVCLLASCRKEAVEKQYPDTLTINNCEEFVDAPQEMIDELERQELQALAVNNPDSIIPPNNIYYDPLGSTEIDSGNVVAYDGTWRNIEYVRVTAISYFTTTTAAMNSVNYRMSRSASSGKTLSVKTNHLNGVTALDRLLVMRHIQGIQPFTSYHQMCAADVNGNDVVDSSDENLIRDAIIGNINAFPSGNVHFIPYPLYLEREGDWLNSNAFDNWTYTGATDFNDYRAIKVGDVNGTFNF